MATTTPANKTITKPTSKTISKPASKSTSKPANETISKRVIDELTNEINNMLSYAIYNGITINTDINSLIKSKNVENLINAHNLLVKNIAPATPKSIEFTKNIRVNEKNKSIFNRLPLVRNLIVLSLFFLTMFIATGLSPDVNNNSLDEGVLNNNGWSLLLNICFLASISGLGVLFFLLKKVSDSIKESTLVSEEAISYIAQIILGIIAGILMSEIISFYSNDPKSINLFNKSAMALIGGFSSDALFSILQNMIDRIKSIFVTSNT